MLWISDNINLQVYGNTVFICNCINNVCIRWSSNPDFINWIREQSEKQDYFWSSVIYNQKYTCEFKKLTETYPMW